MSVLRLIWSLSLVAAATIGCQPREPKAPTRAAKAPSVETKAASVAPAATPDPDSWRSVVPAASTGQAVNYPPTDRHYSRSGLALYSITRNTPTQSLAIVCKAGASYDPIGRAGTSGLVARMLTEGTKRLDAEALAIAAERLGADLQASSGDDLLTVQLEVLPESANKALELLSDVIRYPGFRDRDFARVQREWLDNLKSQSEDPSTLAGLIARRALLGPKAGQNPLGAPSEVIKLTTADLRSFHQSAIVPSRCAVLSAGPLSATELEALAHKQLGSWNAAPGKAERRSPQWAPHSRVLFLERSGAVQTSVFLASSTPGRKVPGFEARHVINSYFGGIHTSRITTNLRERNAFTYGAYSRLTANADFGIWSIETDVKSEVTNQAIEQLSLERQKLVDGSPPGAEEVQRAKASLIQRNNARLEHTNVLLSALQVEFGNDLDANYFATAGSVIEHLTHADLEAQIPHFAPTVSVLVLVGPRELLKNAGGWFNAPIQIIEPSWLDSDLP